jgi:hypothetical protein
LQKPTENDMVNSQALQALHGPSYNVVQVLGYHKYAGTCFRQSQTSYGSKGNKHRELYLLAKTHTPAIYASNLAWQYGLFFLLIVSVFHF